MIPDLSNPAFKLLVPFAGICISLFVADKKNISHEELLLVKPSSGDVIRWLIIWIAFITITDIWFNWRGEFDFAIWHEQPLWVSVCRVLGVGIAGPVLEELIFRGFIFRKLSQYIQNKWLVITLISAVWASIHQEYNSWIMLLIFFNGIILGISMIKSRSIYVPMLLHVVWNLYAVW